jgi:quercetin dioxygenase-like cupin family protein
MAGLEHKNFSKADETRLFEAGMGQMELIHTHGGPVGLATFQPGWRWTLHIKPIAGTDSCQAEHTTFCVSGRMQVRMDDGETFEVGPGDYAHIPAGHDAWTVGDEPCVLVDWQGFGDYAKKQ